MSKTAVTEKAETNENKNCDESNPSEEIPLYFSITF